jgi:hypothetical protein
MVRWSSAFVAALKASASSKSRRANIAARSSAAPINESSANIKKK